MQRPQRLDVADVGGEQRGGAPARVLGREGLARVLVQHIERLQAAPGRRAVRGRLPVGVHEEQEVLTLEPHEHLEHGRVVLVGRVVREEEGAVRRRLLHLGIGARHVEALAVPQVEQPLDHARVTPRHGVHRGRHTHRVDGRQGFPPSQLLNHRQRLLVPLVGRSVRREPFAIVGLEERPDALLENERPQPHEVALPEEPMCRRHSPSSEKLTPAHAEQPRGIALAVPHCLRRSPPRERAWPAQLLYLASPESSAAC
mmetsp:Transcript_56040/g.137444  ORF Transcript_56040/g.137444 Transcript_56040/m.137444 type:complete len:257 (-) Transcript_56040:166-936(-)